jgi:hypothetical protein
MKRTAQCAPQTVPARGHTGTVDGWFDLVEPEGCRKRAPMPMSTYSAHFEFICASDERSTCIEAIAAGRPRSEQTPRPASPWPPISRPFRPAPGSSSVSQARLRAAFAALSSDELTTLTRLLQRVRQGLPMSADGTQRHDGSRDSKSRREERHVTGPARFVASAVLRR